jgi:hypothetical protein
MTKQETIAPEHMHIWSKKPFQVSAGKYDDEGRDIKYAENFSSMEEAITVYKSLFGYPWREIVYCNQLTRTLCEIEIIPRMQGVRLFKNNQLFTLNSAMGKYTSKIVGPHRDNGYYETVILSGGHPALLNSIQIVSHRTIQAALVKEGYDYSFYGDSDEDYNY